MKKYNQFITETINNEKIGDVIKTPIYKVKILKIFTPNYIVGEILEILDKLANINNRNLNIGDKSFFVLK